MSGGKRSEEVKRRVESNRRSRAGTTRLGPELNPHFFPIHETTVPLDDELRQKHITEAKGAVSQPLAPGVQIIYGAVDQARLVEAVGAVPKVEIPVTVNLSGDTSGALPPENVTGSQAQDNLSARPGTPMPTMVTDVEESGVLEQGQSLGKGENRVQRSSIGAKDSFRRMFGFLPSSRRTRSQSSDGNRTLLGGKSSSGSTDSLQVDTPHLEVMLASISELKEQNLLILQQLEKIEGQQRQFSQAMEKNQKQLSTLRVDLLQAISRGIGTKEAQSAELTDLKLDVTKKINELTAAVQGLKSTVLSVELSVVRAMSECGMSYKSQAEVPAAVGPSMREARVMAAPLTPAATLVTRTKLGDRMMAVAAMSRLPLPSFLAKYKEFAEPYRNDKYEDAWTALDKIEESLRQSK